MRMSHGIFFYGEWDREGFVIPEEFRLDENSKLHEAIHVFYSVGGYDFFRVTDPEQYAANWLDFLGCLYSEIDEGKYESDGQLHKNPLCDEQRKTLAAQGVPEIFAADMI